MSLKRSIGGENDAGAAEASSAKAALLAAGRRGNMRERPITVTKRLPVFHTAANDAALVADEVEPLKKDEKVVAARKKEAKKDKKIHIPTPNARTVPEYQDVLRLLKPFKRTKHYAIFNQECGAGLLTPHIRYDVKDEDVAWIKQHNSTPGNSTCQLSELLMDVAFTAWEYEAWKMSQNVDCSDEVNLDRATDLVCGGSGHTVMGASKDETELNYVPQATLKPAQAKVLYSYWLEKRKRLNKALIRNFEAPPAVEDPSPFVAFRPRTNPRRVSHRNPRKNDAVAYDKLRLLRKDFDRKLEILKVERTREVMKRESFLLGAEIFDAQLLNSAFGKKFTAFRKHSVSIPGANATQQQNVPMPSSAEQKVMSEVAHLMQSTLPKAKLNLTSKSRDHDSKRSQKKRRPGARSHRPGVKVGRSQRMMEAGSSSESEQEVEDAYFQQVAAVYHGTHPSCNRPQSLRAHANRAPDLGKYLTSEEQHGYVGICRPVLGRLGRQYIERYRFQIDDEQRTTSKEDTIADMWDEMQAETRRSMRPLSLYNAEAEGPEEWGSDVGSVVVPVPPAPTQLKGFMLDDLSEDMDGDADAEADDAIDEDNDTDIGMSHTARKKREVSSGYGWGALQQRVSQQWNPEFSVNSQPLPVTQFGVKSWVGVGTLPSSDEQFSSQAEPMNGDDGLLNDGGLSPRNAQVHFTNSVAVEDPGDQVMQDVEEE